MTDQPAWRSLLFVPTHVEKFVAAASRHGADAYILDLEDSVPVDIKGAARKALAAAVRQVSTSGASALVRINADGNEMGEDVRAAVEARVDTIVLPKVSRGSQIQEICACLDQLEPEHAVPIRLLAQIEDVSALPHLDEIAASGHGRLIGLSLGSEDFSASAGIKPLPETLYWPSQQVVFAARRQGIYAFGFPASIADYRDLRRFGRTIRRARAMGFIGAMCVHPSQIAVLNEGFAPSALEIEQAKQIIAVFQAAQAEGRAAASLQGQMIDPPVAARAQAVLARSAKFASIAKGSRA